MTGAAHCALCGILGGPAYPLATAGVVVRGIHRGRALCAGTPLCVFCAGHLSDVGSDEESAPCPACHREMKTFHALEGTT